MSTSATHGVIPENNVGKKCVFLYGSD